MRFWAPSSPSSPPRTALARRPSPAGGVLSGAHAGSDLTDQDQKRLVFVSKILSDHPGPARRFSLPCMRLRDRYAKINGWLRSQTLTGLEEIQFGYEIEDPLLHYPLPPSALRFARTLRIAYFGYCDFPREMAPLLKFPCLKQLNLCGVIVLEDVLHSLLCGCPVLESLLLEGNVGVGCLRINSSTLRSIGISVSCYGTRVENPILLQDLIIEDAPCLERLLPLYPIRGPLTIRVVWAPKLEILGWLSDSITKLHIGTTVFQKMIALSLTTSMRSTVKVLALDTFGPNLDSVVDFLKCFPCLQKLYIKMEDIFREQLWRKRGRPRELYLDESSKDAPVPPDLTVSNCDCGRPVDVF